MFGIFLIGSFNSEWGWRTELQPHTPSPKRLMDFTKLNIQLCSKLWWAPDVTPPFQCGCACSVWILATPDGQVAPCMAAPPIRVWMMSCCVKELWSKQVQSTYNLHNSSTFPFCLGSVSASKILAEGVRKESYVILCCSPWLIDWFICRLPEYRYKSIEIARKGGWKITA